jgi:hypothetical protein
MITPSLAAGPLTPYNGMVIFIPDIARDEILVDDPSEDAHLSGPKTKTPSSESPETRSSNHEFRMATPPFGTMPASFTYPYLELEVLPTDIELATVALLEEGTQHYSSLEASSHLDD